MQLQAWSSVSKQMPLSLSQLHDRLGKADCEKPGEHTPSACCGRSFEPDPLPPLPAEPSEPVSVPPRCSTCPAHAVNAATRNNPTPKLARRNDALRQPPTVFCICTPVSTFWSKLRATRKRADFRRGVPLELAATCAARLPICALLKQAAARAPQETAGCDSAPRNPARSPRRTRLRW